MKNESKNTEYSLYCKQRSVESWFQRPWACGPSSFITAARLLGDRNISANRVIRSIGVKSATDGILGDQLIRVARKFGYTAKPFPYASRYYSEDFRIWLKKMWSKGYPTVISTRCKQRK